MFYFLLISYDLLLFSGYIYEFKTFNWKIVFYYIFLDLMNLLGFDFLFWNQFLNFLILFLIISYFFQIEFLNWLKVLFYINEFQLFMFLIINLQFFFINTFTTVKFRIFLLIELYLLIMLWAYYFLVFFYYFCNIFKRFQQS